MCTSWLFVLPTPHYFQFHMRRCMWHYNALQMHCNPFCELVFHVSAPMELEDYHFVFNDGNFYVHYYVILQTCHWYKEISNCIVTSFYEHVIHGGAYVELKHNDFVFIDEIILCGNCCFTWLPIRFIDVWHKLDHVKVLFCKWSSQCIGHTKLPS